MALIDTTSPLTATQRATNQIREDSARLHLVMLFTHQSIYRTLWDADDPQAVLDELGADATSLFVSGAKVVEIILGQNPNALTPEQYIPQRVPTFNQNGTVTLAPATP